MVFLDHIWEINMSESKLPLSNTVWPHQGNLLSSAVRRDIADLNRLFLAHALDPGHGADCWFQLPSATVRRLVEVPPEARERAACCPISLFELVLPQDDEALPWRLESVADSEVEVTLRTRDATRRSFGLVALGVARRLAESVPFSSRIAFGFGSKSEARLSSLTPSDSFRLASWPGLVRPRWPGHTRYWSLLAEAAAGTAQEDLNWAYSAGLCLLGHCERDPVVARSGPARRPRPTHRRGVAGETDVPC
jgi:hypothetical protein